MRAVDEQMKDSEYEKARDVPFYTFYRTPTQLQSGHIKRAFATGMIKTGFRPSDDPNDHAYNIPGNAMLCTYMGLLSSQIFSKVAESSFLKKELDILSTKMKSLSEEIKLAILEFGVVEVDGKEVFAYEVNGKGQSKTFDDANLPSLLSLPYLKFVEGTNKIYKHTRQNILSIKNPYYFHNGKIKGIGSSHTPQGNIWPLALITQILTTNKEEEIRNCL